MAPQGAATLLSGAGAVAVVGFCGVGPDLRPGDVVVATEIRGPEGVTPARQAASW